VKPKNTQTAISNKIKKWLETVEELSDEQFRFAIPITRLTSIKSLCQDEAAATQFALYLAQSLQAQITADGCPSHVDPAEWEHHQTVIANAIAAMAGYVENQQPEVIHTRQGLLRQIDKLQGDDVRKVSWNTVHFVKSGDLLR
jgi:hypothetical protein